MSVFYKFRAFWHSCKVVKWFCLSCRLYKAGLLALGITQSVFFIVAKILFTKYFSLRALFLAMMLSCLWSCLISLLPMLDDHE